MNPDELNELIDRPLNSEERYILVTKLLPSYENMNTYPNIDFIPFSSKRTLRAEQITNKHLMLIQQWILLFDPEEPGAFFRNAIENKVQKIINL